MMKPLFSNIHQNNLPFEIRDLTYREWEVLLALADDLNNAEIGNRFNLTEKSVQNYRNRIASKLNLHGRDELARYARKHAGILRQWYEMFIYPPPLI